MRLVKQCAALALLLAVAAMPAALAAERAAVTVYSGGVDFLPNVDWASARLVVSGNGITFARTIGRDWVERSYGRDDLARGMLAFLERIASEASA